MLQMISIKAFFIWSPQKCLACRVDFQRSEWKSFQIKTALIVDRSNKTLNVASGGMLIIFSRDMLNDVLGSFHIILLRNPTDICVCIRPHFNIHTIISLMDKYTF
jgi:hypothetical protein